MFRENRFTDPVLDQVSDLVDFCVNVVQTEVRYQEEAKEPEVDPDVSWEDLVPASQAGDADNPEESEESESEAFDPERIPGAILRMSPASDDGELSMDLPVHQRLNDSVYDTGDSSENGLGLVSAVDSDSEYAEISLESGSSRPDVFEFVA